MKIFMLALFMASVVFADDSLSTKIHDPYVSMRAMGMGNAFTAVADDYSLIFYNPAGFAKKRYNEVQFTLAAVGYSPNTLTLADELKTATASGNDQQKATAVSNVLDKYYGKTLGGKVQAAEIFWTRKNWGVALIPVDLTVDMSFNRQLGPAIDMNVIADTTIAYGYGKELDKFWSAGLTAKYVHRDAIDQSVSFLELAADSNLLSTKRFKEGSSIDLNLGFMWTPDWFNKSILKTEAKTEEKKVEEKKPAEDNRTIQSEEPSSEAASGPAAEALPSAAKPEEKAKIEEKPEPIKEAITGTTERFPLTFGLVINNILGGNFSKSNQVNKDALEIPTSMYRTIDLGSHYEMAKFGDLTLRSMIDFKNLLHPDITLNKSFHAGVEFDYFPNSWFKTQFRVGLNQMYATGGFTFLFGVIHIDAVTYGEEVGSATTKIQNRVYAAKLGFNF